MTIGTSKNADQCPPELNYYVRCLMENNFSITGCQIKETEISELLTPYSKSHSHKGECNGCRSNRSVEHDLKLQEED